MTPGQVAPGGQAAAARRRNGGRASEKCPFFHVVESARDQVGHGRKKIRRNVERSRAAPSPASRCRIPDRAFAALRHLSPPDVTFKSSFQCSVTSSSSNRKSVTHPHRNSPDEFRHTHANAIRFLVPGSRKSAEKCQIVVHQ